MPSAAACAAARTVSSDIDCPTSAVSTPRARTGVPAMLVRPMRASVIVPPSTLTVAATATMDQACATRLNFSYRAPQPVYFGKRIAVRISCGPMAVVK